MKNPGNIFISEGDPAGISYELLAGAGYLLKQTASKYRIILVTSQDNARAPEFKPLSEKNLNKLPPGMYSFQTGILSSAELKSIKPGKPSVASGTAAYQSLIAAIKLQKKYGGDMITLPLSKEWIIRSGIKNFTGHTETLAMKYGRQTFMLMYGKELKVIPLTTHIPLKKVAAKISTFDYKNFSSAILKFFGKNIKILMLGLNPHAGEGGKMGNEEKVVLEPMIKNMKRLGLDISGPFPADSAFIASTRNKYGLFLSCYHDQGLIPFKMLVDKKGVNITLGLDFIRVSPDHGTAFDIAGKNLADAGSFKECLKLLQN